MEYKIIDTSQYDYMGLERLLNSLAEDGWRVVCMMHDDILLGRKR